MLQAFFLSMSRKMWEFARLTKKFSFSKATDTITILLTSSVKYRSLLRFFYVRVLRHKSRGKKSACILPHEPRTRLIRGVYSCRNNIYSNWRKQKPALNFPNYMFSQRVLWNGISYAFIPSHRGNRCLITCNTDCILVILFTLIISFTRPFFAVVR